jgi:O-acetylhomoserine (thiol)-lyase
VFDSTEHAAELFALRTYGNIYTRIGNPTVAASKRSSPASKAGSVRSRRQAAGGAAHHDPERRAAGDHLVASANLYGGTVTQFSVTLQRMGIETTFVAPAISGAVRAAMRPNTRALFVETIGNPNGNVADSQRWPRSRTRPACRWSSTTPLRRRICAGRSSTAPTSSSTRRRSSSAATAP